jgi:hypothetical protein
MRKFVIFCFEGLAGKIRMAKELWASWLGPGMSGAKLRPPFGTAPRFGTAPPDQHKEGLGAFLS